MPYYSMKIVILDWIIDTFDLIMLTRLQLDSIFAIVILTFGCLILPTGGELIRIKVLSIVALLMIGCKLIYIVMLV